MTDSCSPDFETFVHVVVVVVVVAVVVVAVAVVEDCSWCLHY